MSKIHIRLNLEPLVEWKARELGKSRHTQQELPGLSGVLQATLSRWLSNKVDACNREILEKLMQTFDCHLEDLFEITVDKTDYGLTSP